jgi:elongation factor 1-beta
MVDVIAVLRVIPEKDANKDEIKNKIKEIVEKNEGYLNEIKESPFVFGLIALDVTVILDEKKPQNLDKIEEELSKVENVNSVEVTHLDRM